MFTITVDDGVLLAADPQRGQLIVYAVRVVAELLATLSSEDSRDDDRG